MRIQIISDVHSEFHQDGGRSFACSLDTTGVDVLVVAGDLGLMGFNLPILRGLCARYPHVVFVLGNHEFYGHSREQVLRLCDQAKGQLRNLHPLENATVTIEGQRFVGSTLWFPDSHEARGRQNLLNDYTQIQDFETWVYGLNQHSIQYLSDTVCSTDVVVTHHIPTFQGVAAKWRGSPLNHYFVCPLDALIQARQPRLWIFGHTHESHDSQMGQTRLVCNPFGYLRQEENPAFDWGKKVDLP